MTFLAEQSKHKSFLISMEEPASTPTSRQWPKKLKMIKTLKLKFPTISANRPETTSSKLPRSDLATESSM